MIKNQLGKRSLMTSRQRDEDVTNWTLHVVGIRNIWDGYDGWSKILHFLWTFPNT